jgi:lipid A 4'-phosphatase
MQRRPWLAEALTLLTLAALITAVFAATPLDIAAARLFYRPASPDPWPLAAREPWSLLYAAAPWITASLVLGGLALLAAGRLRRQEWQRRCALLLLLALALGPGLLVNGVFKDHWARPRPREILQLGGALSYVPAPLPGRNGGASFPCGHCSVGFLYGAGWWIWRRRRPAWARASLVLGIAAGLALGLGRMAAGAHFLSDVLWSALLAYGVCHVLSYQVLHLEADGGDAGAPARRLHPLWMRLAAPAAVAGGVAVLLALFATAHGTRISARIPLASLPQTPRALEFDARAADVQIVLMDTPAATAAGEISVAGELHGFGLPGSRLAAGYEFVSGPAATLRYRFEQSGRFTDLGGYATVLLPAAAVERVVVSLDRGNIVVRDETQSGVVRRHAVALELHTGRGQVEVLARPPRAALSR